MAKRKSSNDKLLSIVTDALLDKKGHEVISLDLRNIKDTPSDYFVISHGDSATQVKALCDSVLEATAKKGHKPYRTEGTKNGEWIVIDFIDIVVHIFYREKRDFYALEDLWSDATLTEHT